MKQLVIIGNSAAGSAAAFKARELDKNIKITVISEERTSAYFRNKLGSVFDESLKFSDIVFADAPDYQSKDISLLLGKKVEKINTNKNWIILTDKTKIAYDALIVASGVSMSVPKCIKGGHKHGVAAFRSISDISDIQQLLPISNTVCIWGAGFAGLQAAFALKKKRMEVKLIIRGKELLPDILDANGQEFIRNLLKDQGIDLITERNVIDIFGEGDVKAIKLDNKKVIACDILIINNSFSANTGFLDDCGLGQDDLSEGLEADLFLNLKTANIFAAGDVLKTSHSAQRVYDRPYSWDKAVRQGRVAAANAVALLTDNQALKQVFEPESINSDDLRFFGLPAVCLGITAMPEENDLEQFSFVDEDRKSYKKIVLSDSRIVGFVGLGSIEDKEMFAKLIQSRTNISRVKDDLIDADFDFEMLRSLIG